MTIFKKIVNSIKQTGLLIYGSISVLVNLSAIGLIVINSYVYIALFILSILILLGMFTFNFVFKQKLSEIIKNNFEDLNEEEKIEIRTIINGNVTTNAPDNDERMSHIPRRQIHSQVVDVII
jgi:hypothetical protein